MSMKIYLRGRGKSWIVLSKQPLKYRQILAHDVSSKIINSSCLIIVRRSVPEI